MDLQGFLSRNLVNISEALTVLLASPRRLQGVRRCVRILTSAAVRHKGVEGGHPPVVCCLPDQDEKTGWKILWKEKAKKNNKTETKQKVQRRKIRRPQAPSAAKFAPLDVLQQLLLL